MHFLHHIIYSLENYLKQCETANIWQNSDLQNSNFTLFHIILYYFSLTEILYTYQYTCLNPTADLPPNVSPSHQLHFPWKPVFLPVWVYACCTAVIPFAPFLEWVPVSSIICFHLLWFIPLFCWNVILYKLPEERCMRDKTFCIFACLHLPSHLIDCLSYKILCQK